MDGGPYEPTGALLPQRGGDHLRARQVPGARTLRGAISRRAWLPSRSINPKIEDLGVIRWDDMGTLVVLMPEDTCPVQWTGQQAVVTLPQHIDSSNADQIREQLLWIINRGAAVLIVDLTGTVSCDYSGADALARAHHRAVANGTELRLAVIADVVRRVLSLSGLDRLVAVYSDLDGAIAAGARGAARCTVRNGPGTADRAARAEELLDWASQHLQRRPDACRPLPTCPATSPRSASPKLWAAWMMWSGKSVITCLPSAASRSSPASPGGARRTWMSISSWPRIARRCCISAWRKRRMHCVRCGGYRCAAGAAG